MKLNKKIVMLEKEHFQEAENMVLQKDLPL